MTEVNNNVEATEVENTQAETTKTEVTKEKKYTDEDVNKIIDSKFAKWQKDMDSKLEDERHKASLNAKELAEYESQKKDKELEEARAELNKFKMTNVATSKLSEKGLLASDEILSFVVKSDELSTVKAVESFSNLVEKTVNEQLKERAKQSTPTTSQGISNNDGFSIREFAEQNRIIKK